MMTPRSHWERDYIDDTEEPLGERDYILTTPRSYSGDAIIYIDDTEELLGDALIE